MTDQPKIALITGASRGLGFHLAEALAPDYHIVAVAKTTGALEELDDRIKAKGGDATLFLLEIDYVGIFHVENVPEDQMHPFLLIECPRMIFPFLRRVVSDVTRDGGFPPLNLENIDFVALYRNEIARRQAENTQKADA